MTKNNEVEIDIIQQLKVKKLKIRSVLENGIESRWGPRTAKRGWGEKRRIGQRVEGDKRERSISSTQITFSHTDRRCVKRTAEVSVPAARSPSRISLILTRL